MADPGVRVLLVDDNFDLANLYAHALSSEPGLINAGVLTSADNLLAVCRERSVDVVLLDLTMPGKDPLKAVSELRSAVPNCRVIVFSGFDDQERIDRAIEAGAWGFLGKHVPLDEVLEALHRVGAGEVVC